MDVLQYSGSVFLPTQLPKLPINLKSDCINQIDQLLSELDSEQLLGITLSNHIAEDHLSTSIVIQSIQKLHAIKTEWIQLDNGDCSIDELGTFLVFSENGDTYLVNSLGQNEVRIKRYIAPGEELESFDLSISDMLDGLGIIPVALSCQKDTRADIEAPKPLMPEADGVIEDSYVWQHFINKKSTIFSIIGISVALALLGVITPLGFQTFTDKILPYQAENSLIVVAILLVVAAVSTAIFNYFQDYQESVLFAKYQSGLGKEVFERLLAMEVPYFDSRKVGELTKLIDQIEEASNFLVKQFLGAIVAVISLLVVLPILFLYDVNLTLIVLGVGLIMALTIGLSLKPLRQRVMKAYRYDAGFQSTLIETLKGMRTLKALAVEPFFLQRANHSLDINLYGSFHVAKLSNGVRALVSFQSQMITICVIFFGAQAVFAQTLTIGQLIAFNMLANNVVNPLVSLVFTASGYETYRLAKRKLNELQPKKELVMPIAPDQVSLAGKIIFKDVWFKYPHIEEYVLKGVSFTIEQGDIAGIVGGSGSGKSTVAALIMGFYKPDKGSIEINGYDISILPSSILRGRIASVQQTNFLFNTSVLQNVHLGRMNASVEDIQESLVQSGSEEFVNKLPEKFMTVLSEDANNLSGGQKQRLAIARALIRDADLLLFDEATSALDNQTEETIKQTVYQALQDRTGIIIAHRLNTLSYCNRIVVMKDGEVEAVGDHDELLLTENSYRAMWQSMDRDT